MVERKEETDHDGGTDHYYCCEDENEIVGIELCKFEEANGYVSGDNQDYNACHKDGEDLRSVSKSNRRIPGPTWLSIF